MPAVRVPQIGFQEFGVHAQSVTQFRCDLRLMASPGPFLPVESGSGWGQKPTGCINWAVYLKDRFRGIPVFQQGGSEDSKGSAAAVVLTLLRVRIRPLQDLEIQAPNFPGLCLTRHPF